MYPFGLERFYGGLKLAITENGIPVPEEWTKGEFVDESILPYCISAAQNMTVWCCFWTAGVPEFGRYSIINIQQVVRDTVKDCMMFVEKKVLFKIQSLDENSVLDNVELNDMFISRQHLARYFVKRCMNRLLAINTELSSRSMTDEDLLKTFRKFIGELSLVDEELTSVEQKLLASEEQKNNMEESK
jgi:hypothetical protein